MVSLSVLSVSSSCFPSDVVHSCFIPCFIYLSCYFPVYFLILTTFLLCFVQSFTGGLYSVPHPFLNQPLCVHSPIVLCCWFCVSFLVCSLYFAEVFDLFCFWTLDSSFSLMKSFFFSSLEFLIL